MGLIKNVIFDLGGVLLNIDYNKTTAAFKALGFPHFEKMYSQFTADRLFENLEKGKITPDDFFKIMLSAGNEGITRRQVEAAWNSMLLDFRTTSLDFLVELKSSYNLYLLSNTNAIHLEALNVILKSQTGYDSLEPFFTRAWFSHLTGFRKPDEEIFNYILEDGGLNASDSLFIDDSSNNIETARKVGLKTHLLSNDEKIEDLSYNTI